jgi:cephalosporin-C deacetylase
MIMGMGLQDNICPIHTNFAGYNVVSSEKSWICYPKATHNVWIQPHWKQAKEDFFRAQILRGGK